MKNYPACKELRVKAIEFAAILQKQTMFADKMFCFFPTFLTKKMTWNIFIYHSTFYISIEEEQDSSLQTHPVSLPVTFGSQLQFLLSLDQPVLYHQPSAKLLLYLSNSSSTSHKSRYHFQFSIFLQSCKLFLY